MKTNKNTIHIQFIFTRHGYSCANFVNDIKYAHNNILTSDPILTNIGIQQSHELNGFLKENKIIPDIVLCSKFKRAIETSIEAYDGIVDHVYPVPFISEIFEPEYTNTDFSIIHRKNDPDKIDHLINYFKNNKNNTLDVDLSFTKFIENNLKTKGFSDDELNVPNFDHFIKYIIPLVIEKISLKKKVKNNKIFRIAVVSHYLFLMKHFDVILKNTGNTISMYDNTDTWVEDVNIEYSYKDDHIGKYHYDNVKYFANKLVKLYGQNNQNIKLLKNTIDDEPNFDFDPKNLSSNLSLNLFIERCFINDK